MTSRGPYRRHSTPFKLQLCQDIRSGVIGRRDAQRTYGVSANLIQLWLTQFDRGELNDEEAEASVIAEYEVRIAAHSSARSANSRWSWILPKKRRACRSPATARPSSSPALSLFRQTGVRSDRSARSTFYYRATTKTSGLSDLDLVTLIEDIQDELPCYGYRRVTHELRRRGYLVNHKTVARVMRAAGLGITAAQALVRTTDSSHNSPIYPNLYRNVIPDRPDMVWVADFTYIRIANGFCYLAVILDACSRRVVGYALSRRLDTH